MMYDWNHAKSILKPTLIGALISLQSENGGVGLIIRDPLVGAYYVKFQLALVNEVPAVRRVATKPNTSHGLHTFGYFHSRLSQFATSDCNI